MVSLLLLYTLGYSFNRRKGGGGEDGFLPKKRHPLTVVGIYFAFAGRMHARQKGRKREGKVGDKKAFRVSECTETSGFFR